MAEGGGQRRNHDFGLFFGSAGIVFIPQRCHDQFPQTGWLKTREILFCLFFVFFSEFRHQNVIMAVLRRMLQGGALPCFSWLVVVTRCPCYLASVFTRPSSFLIVTIPELPPLTRIPVTGLQLTQSIRPLINNLITSVKTRFPNQLHRFQQT